MDKLLKQTIANALKEILGGRITDDDALRKQHGEGFSYHDCMPPDFVVYPHTTEEIAAVVRVCSEYQIAIVPFGAGTSVEGHVVALKGGVCIDMKEMNRVVEVNYSDMYVTVQAGVTRNQLDELLQGSGFFFPVGPGVNATLGGMASTRASGTNAVRYGTMKDNVIALAVVLPGGQIIKTAGKARKSSAGYDLTRLFVGSEGTLGIITELTIKLYSYPEAVKTAVCTFPTVEDAVNTAIKTIQAGIPIAKIELLDALMMRAINLYSSVSYPERPTLFLEFHGSALAIDEQIEKVGQYARALDGDDFIMEKDEATREKLWRIRTDAAPAAAALLPGSKLMSTDVCVPISRLAKCIVETQADIEVTGIIAPILGHVGDGNFHVAILTHTDDRPGFEKAKALNERLVRRALEMEGTCSGEHGIGIGKLPFMRPEHGEAVDVMLAIKKAIDPRNIMNPGKLLPS